MADWYSDDFSWYPRSPISEPDQWNPKILANIKYFHARMIAGGWTSNAICGQIGNFMSESSMNPGIWQGATANKKGSGPAYGLAQWDPASKYINWCNDMGLEPSDINSAVRRINWEFANGQQYYKTKAYPLTAAEYKTSTKSPNYLARAWLVNYERPKNQNQPQRGEYADAIYAWVNNNPYVPTPEPPRPDPDPVTPTPDPETPTPDPIPTPGQNNNYSEPRRRKRLYVLGHNHGF